jgi:hypothetical protein
MFSFFIESFPKDEQKHLENGEIPNGAVSKTNLIVYMQLHSILLFVLPPVIFEKFCVFHRTALIGGA